MLLAYRPKLSVVVVKKRISARFFARIDGKIANPPPGTVIDTEVTRPEWCVLNVILHMNIREYIKE